MVQAFRRGGTSLREAAAQSAALDVSSTSALRVAGRWRGSRSFQGAPFIVPWRPGIGCRSVVPAAAPDEEVRVEGSPGGLTSASASLARPSRRRGAVLGRSLRWGSMGEVVALFRDNAARALGGRRGGTTLVRGVV